MKYSQDIKNIDLDEKSRKEDVIQQQAHEICEVLMKIIKKVCDKRAQYIIKEHCFNEKSYAEIGKKLNISRIRVYQIFQKNITKVRETYERKLDASYPLTNEKKSL